MIRSFVAVGLPPEVRARLEHYGKELKKLGLYGSFPKAESLHLTLKFLGDIPEAKIDVIGEALERAVTGVAPFQLEVRGLGAFPNPWSARIIWIGFDESEALVSLQTRVEAVLEDLDFPREDRPFRPHLTLARLKSKDHLTDLQAYLREAGPSASAGTVPVDEVVLFRSELRPDGARYTRLRAARLQGIQESKGD